MAATLGDAVLTTQFGNQEVWTLFEGGLASDRGARCSWSMRTASS